MKFRRVGCPTYTFVALLLGMNSALGQTPRAMPRLAHDSDLDELLVTRARASHLLLLTQPVVSTPQAITTIPEEVIQLQAATDLRDVLRNDPSVSAHADEDNAQGTNVYIRGFPPVSIRISMVSWTSAVTIAIHSIWKKPRTNGTRGWNRTSVGCVQSAAGMPATHSCVGSGGRNRTCVGCVQSAAGMPATHT
jgi:hypothetical protein